MPQIIIGILEIGNPILPKSSFSYADEDLILQNIMPHKTITGSAKSANGFRPDF